MNEEKYIEFKNISFGYKRNKPIFKDLSFKVTKPEDKGFVVGLMGGSGSGKSTLLKLILGIETKYTGTVSIFPQKATISYVPQEPVLFEHLSPMENARYFERISNYKSLFRENLFNETARILQIKDVLQTAKSVNEISGGQKQRISLLRALSIAPDILLLDEPLTGLDEEVKDMFLLTVATLVKQYDLLVVYITHHRKEVEFVADKILYLIKDNNLELVNSVSYDDTESFFITPPTIPALKAAKAITSNTLFFRLNSNNEIVLLKEKVENACLMYFEESVIHFNSDSDSGFEFEPVTSTGKYSILKLKESGALLTVSNQKFEQYGSYNFISFNGEVSLYDTNGIFSKITKIENNEFIN
jgi:ABC-type multidrug transport system ATPase subunit